MPVAIHVEIPDIVLERYPSPTEFYSLLRA